MNSAAVTAPPGAVSSDISDVLAAHATGYAVGGRVNEVNEERWGALTSFNLVPVG